MFVQEIHKKTIPHTKHWFKGKYISLGNLTFAKFVNSDVKDPKNWKIDYPLFNSYFELFDNDIDNISDTNWDEIIIALEPQLKSRQKLNSIHLNNSKTFTSIKSYIAKFPIQDWLCEMLQGDPSVENILLWRAKYSNKFDIFTADTANYIVAGIALLATNGYMLVKVNQSDFNTNLITLISNYFKKTYKIKPKNKNDMFIAFYEYKQMKPSTFIFLLNMVNYWSLDMDKPPIWGYLTI
jgi:hypothetical protein